MEGFVFFVNTLLTETVFRCIFVFDLVFNTESFFKIKIVINRFNIKSLKIYSIQDYWYYTTIEEPPQGGFFI